MGNHSFDSVFGQGGAAPAAGSRAPAAVRHGGTARALFVCTANISRSPYAEVRARQLFGEDSAWSFTSAGIPGMVDKPMDANMAQQAIARGVNPLECQSMRSRQVRPGLLTRADLVITMEKAHRVRLLEEYPWASEHVITLGQLVAVAENPALGTIPRDPRHPQEPWLLGAIRLLKPHAQSAGDVADPFGHGVDAAERAARLIDAALMTVRPLFLHL